MHGLGMLHTHWFLALTAGPSQGNLFIGLPTPGVLAMGQPLPERWANAIDDHSLPLTNHMGYLWQWQPDPSTGQKQWYAIRRVPEADPPTVVMSLGATAKAAGTVPMHCYIF